MDICARNYINTERSKRTLDAKEYQASFNQNTTFHYDPAMEEGPVSISKLLYTIESIGPVPFANVGSWGICLQQGKPRAMHIATAFGIALIRREEATATLRE